MVGGEGDDQLWGVDVVPLLGAREKGDDQHRWVPGCHCWVPLQGARGEGDDQLWGSGRWVPYLGAIVVCYGWGNFFSN